MDGIQAVWYTFYKGGIGEGINYGGIMHAWNQVNIGETFETTQMRKELIRATFQQAKEDGVTVLEIGEDVWGLGEFFHNHIDELIDAFTTAQREIAPDVSKEYLRLYEAGCLTAEELDAIRLSGLETRIS